MLSNFSGDSVTTDFIETSDNENKYLQYFQSLLYISPCSPRGTRESLPALCVDQRRFLHCSHL